MTTIDFEAVVQDTLAELPDWARSALTDVSILVMDAPEPGAVGKGEDDLLGLYVGVPVTERGESEPGELPDVIYLYRRAHLALGLRDDALRAEIRKTLLHEIAHFFGMDDEYLEKIGWD